MNLLISIQSAAEGQHNSLKLLIATSLATGLFFVLRKKRPGFISKLKRKMMLFKMLKKSNRVTDRKGLFGLLSAILVIAALVLLVTSTGTLGLALGLGIASLICFGLYSYY